VENLFAADMAFLQDFYRRINEGGSSALKAVCPKCDHAFEVETQPLGES
jgi:hypothetical protein